MAATKMVRLKRISVMIIGMSWLNSLKVSSSIGFVSSNLHFTLKRAHLQSNINSTTNVLVLILNDFFPSFLCAYLNLTINRVEWH